MMRILGAVFTFCLAVTSIAMPVQAASDDFTVGITVGADSNPPTIPAPVLATPVASTQIDIVWGASIDDQSLSGYKLFRDAVQIATTTLLTYSDTGLTASTTYVYTVQAYDWAMNVSTTSAPSATTTLQAPIVATTTPPSTTGSRLQVQLTGLDIDSTQTTANISWSTNIYAKYALRWGKVSAYDLGFVQNETFKRNHTTTISNLEPGTAYVYELIAYSPKGEEFILSEGSFTTQLAPDGEALENVSNLRAIVEGDSVRLSWTNPSGEDFIKVRIVRNYNFYPGDTSDGFIAYEGKGESLFDTNALQLQNDQYYTVFSYDVHGNISSGAVVKVQKKSFGNTPGNKDTTFDTNDTRSLSSDPQVDTILRIGFIDVDILQDNILLEPLTGVVHVDDHSPVVFQIPYQALPEHLKTIIMTIDDGTSYLLRIDTSKSVYKAVLPRFKVVGPHMLSFKIYDYQTKVLTTFKGQLEVHHVAITQKIEQKRMQHSLQSYAIGAGAFFIFLILLLMIYLAFLRRRDTE